MQTKDQWKRAKDWKVVTAVAAASALGLSGLALAGPGEDSDPQSIDLVDRRSVDSVANTSQVPTTVQQALSQVADSVASGQQTTDSPLDAEPTAQSVQSVQSPAESPVSPAGSPAESPVSPAETPADSPADSPATPADSPVDSPADSPISPADSPAESPADSPVSADSGAADPGSADS